jgi:hypothetical protein
MRVGEERAEGSDDHPQFEHQGVDGEVRSDGVGAAASLEGLRALGSRHEEASEPVEVDAVMIVFGAVGRDERQALEPERRGHEIDRRVAVVLQAPDRRADDGRHLREGDRPHLLQRRRAGGDAPVRLVFEERSHDDREPRRAHARVISHRYRHARRRQPRPFVRREAQGADERLNQRVAISRPAPEVAGKPRGRANCLAVPEQQVRFPTALQQSLCLIVAPIFVWRLEQQRGLLGHLPGIREAESDRPLDRVDGRVREAACEIRAPAIRQLGGPLDGTDVAANTLGHQSSVILARPLVPEVRPERMSAVGARQVVGAPALDEDLRIRSRDHERFLHVGLLEEVTERLRDGGEQLVHDIRA